MKDYLKTNRDNIAAFRHELFLIEQRSAANSADNVPFEKSRLAKKKAAAEAAKKRAEEKAKAEAEAKAKDEAGDKTEDTE